ncbi:hypothetical protein M407DRAFT_23307 [Tulasnella calospora MUT 4182]|uniref:SET domain-containing protein n=1 Tax=Tulasnella calospora MUT 4182 TaxID=1051891 RepID=A0A0C3QLI5_9AGAM|nr:hypothetical protein M407DRAFT_23307 [Tulasnella calospora MUT 4182]
MFPQRPEDLEKMMRELGITTEDVIKTAGNPAALKQLLSSATLRMVGPVRGSGPSDGLSGIVNALEQAKARFQAEKTMLPIPFVAKPRTQLLVSFEFNRRQVLRQENEHAAQMKQTIIGTEIHVSKIPLEQLERVSLQQMDVRKTHKGKYLLCRIITFPVRMFSVHVLVEDVNGDACLMELYNYPGTIGASPQLIEALFPVGSILAIREPTLKSAAHGGDPLLRVDCPSNVVWLEHDDKKLLGVKWDTGDQVHHSPRLPSTEEEWKKQGNSHYQNGWNIPAAVSYSRGLQRFPASSVLKLNRAMAYLQLKYYGAALADCEAVLENKDLSESLKPKALYRAAQALYGMGRWDEAERNFTDMAKKYPAEAPACKPWIQKCTDRRSEASQGKYDWVAAYKVAQGEGSRMDLANFTGPIQIAALPSRGGGRGIVAKRDIKFGELLVVSKAFVFCSKDDFAKPETFSILNLITNCMDVGYGAINPTQAAERIAGDPQAANALNQLYAGPTYEPPPSEYSVAPPGKVNVSRLLRFDEDVHIGRIQGVLSFNSFTVQSLGPGESMPKDTSRHLDTSALFPLPSLFNHSCSPNAHWYCLKDIMIVRATCDIPAGNEVFLSYGGAGDSYLSRAKESCLARLLGSCNCFLCTRDRQAGESVCKQREKIASKISSCTTILAVRSHIKKLDETFKGYPTADRYAMFTANMKLANISQSSSNLDEVLRTLFKCLEYLGLKVTDTSFRGALPLSSRDSLPVKLATIGGSRTGPLLGPLGVDACIAIRNTFGGALNDKARAAKWLKGTVWLHDKCYGGGKELFSERYPDILD